MSELDLSELTEEQRGRLAMIIELRRGWANWQTARYVAIGAAARLIEEQHLSVGEVCSAWECSHATYYRYVAELRARLAGATGPAAEAIGDQAHAGAQQALAVLHAHHDEAAGDE